MARSGLLETTFDQLWDGEDLEDLFRALWQDGPSLCCYAQKFFEWTNGLLSGVSQEPSAVSVNQAKLLLQDKWHEWRSEAPRRHSNHFSNRGHACIFQVYEQGYHKLRLLELSLTPPLIFEPPKPRPQIAQIFLGEEE